MQRVLFVALLGWIQLAATQATKCNGHEGLCNLRFNQVTFAGTHNSGANRVMKYDAKIFMVPAGSCWYRNQDYTFPGQLDFGIRFFDIDTCSKGGKAWTCHSDGYGQPLSEVIRDIANWLNHPAHRNEVIAIRFHDHKGISGFDKFAPLFREHFSGKGGKVDAYPSTNKWPTLGEAVAQNKRVFIFMRDGLCNANCRRSNRYIRPASYADTWIERKLTSKCNGMVEDTRKKCENEYRDLIIVSAFASVGLCNSDLQKKCNPYIRPSAMACYNERKKKGKTVTFLIADYVNQARSNDDVVTVARELNELNMRNKRSI
ncbi:uncharacterized protein LOC135488247 [Lineus longissimus]|uniref:uncharacterized protein LOC135488247 n=1 Tax=Lineus longissimus TaxID=88925 RepID=UPI002B4EBFC3